MRSFLGAWRLIRPVNFVMFFSGVALGGVLAAGGGVFSSSLLGPLLWAMSATAFIGAGANALNDVVDISIDRSNRPDRPLPSGQLTPAVALILGLALTALGVLMAARVSTTHLAIALFAAVLIGLYNLVFKRTPLVGNVVVAVVIATAIVFGALAVEKTVPPAVWAGVLFATSVTLARELVKDVEDVRGDRLVGARTLPLTTPVWQSMMVILGVIAISLVAIPMAATVSRLGASFMALAMPAAGCLLYTSWLLMTSPQEERLLAVIAGRASGWLKVAMGLGVLALFAAAW